MLAYKYISPYVAISWTKRFVKHRPCGLRASLRREKYKNRIKKRPILLLVKDCIESRRKPFCPNKPQRRNYNTVYGKMQIPV